METEKGTVISNSKVKFNWNKQSINWYLESEKNTSFYNETLEKIEPYIKNSKTVLDIGCGIGGFSIEFAKRGYDVTAIDKSSLAIDTLNDRINQMKLENLKTMDISFEGFTFINNYDIVFISYMMGLVNEFNIRNILDKANKHLILVLPFNKVKKDFSINELYNELKIDTKNLEQLNYTNITDMLSEMKKKYSIKKVETDLGQNFNSFEE
ncbi:MAG: class I SAM-dependent methyltransferase, partial [Tissierellia bacterium]|nr:class I SAM-dependent methyltransferase [Tissierellia bacterium]